MKKVTIIGAGLGGLECGYILQKHGYDVTILEKHSVVGGCFQTFKRKSQIFDTGFHYIGGIGNDEVLSQQLKFLELDHLPWLQQDVNETDQIIIGDKVFCLPSGIENYQNRLIEFFPDVEEDIRKYCSLLKHTGDNILEMLHIEDLSVSTHTNLASISAFEYINRTFSNSLLKKIILGAAVKLDNNPSTLSLYALAQISNSYVQSSWKLIGGGQTLINALAKNFVKEGGRIIPDAHVEKLHTEHGTISDVIFNKSEHIKCDYVISDIAPVSTFSLIDDENLLRGIYFRRINRLETTHGFFTINAILKQGSMVYKPYNLFLHVSDSDCWLHSHKRKMDFLINFYPPQNGSYMTALDIITPMLWEDVQRWDFPHYSSDASYKDFKLSFAEECLDIVDQHISHLREHIEDYYISTPLTYKRYTGAVNGSGFGIRKNCSAPFTSILSPRTPLKNLFLTGQNINLHGLLGVTMSSLNTCSLFINKKQLYQEIINK